MSLSMYESKAYDVLEVKKQTHDNYLIVLNCDLNPLPGQFVNVSIPGLGEAPISTASYHPHHLELNVRITGNVTEALTRIKAGDKLLMRGPYGKGFDLHQFKGDSIVVVGGGCGAAPMKGVLEYLDAHREDFHDIIIYFGYRTPEDVLFNHHIPGWTEKFHYNMTVDNNPKKTNIGCPTGFVNKLIDSSKLNNNGKIAVVCGPEVMMNSCAESLKAKGFNDDQIFLSYERHMKCCTGKCGHCMIRGTYVCKDGPVFRYDEAKRLKE